MAHRAKIKLGDEVFEIPEFTLDTKSYYSGEGWRQYTGNGLRRLRNPSSQEDYSKFDLLFMYDSRDNHAPDTETAFFWIPGDMPSPIEDHHAIVFKMIPTSRLHCMVVEPVLGWQDLDGRILPVDTPLERVRQTGTKYKTEILNLIRSGEQDHEDEDRIVTPDVNDVAAVDFTLAPPESSSVTATLPNGVTVELVGLFKGQDQEERQWWYPDGTPAPQGQFAAYEKKVNGTTVRVNSDIQFEYSYLLHFNRSEGLTVRAGASVGRQFGGCSRDESLCVGYVWSNRRDRWEGLPEVGSIKVAAATGPYETEETDFETLKQRDVSLAAGNERVMVALARDWQSSPNTTPMIVVPTTDTLDLRLRHMQEDDGLGTTHCVVVPDEFGRGPDRAALPYHFTIQTASDDIRRILVDYRPADVVRFDNVALKPGRKTNVQAHVRPNTQKASGAPAGPAPLGRYALSFDGVDDCLIAPASPSLTLKPPFTVEVWTKPDLTDMRATETSRRNDPRQTLERHAFFIGQGEGLTEVSEIPRRSIRSTLAGGFQAFIQPGLGRNARMLLPGVAYSGPIYQANEKGQMSQTGLLISSRLTLDRSGWMHFAINPFSDSNYVPAPNGDFVVGGTTIPGMGSFKGEIAEIRVWNHSLSDEETRYYGNSPLTGNEPGLVACWDFERQPGGQIVYDISPNANHAHLGQSIGPDRSDPRWIDLEEEPADETIYEERWDVDTGFNIYLLADEDVDLGTAATMPLDDLVLSDQPWIAAENIERYDWSTHTIYLKEAVEWPVRQVPLKGMPFVVVADGKRCYLGALWSTFSSLTPTHTVPVVYYMRNFSRDMFTIDWLLTVTLDERNDQRVYEALLKYGQLHAGLLVRLDRVDVLLTNSGSSVRYTYTITNDDSDDLLVLDPEKMGADLFHHFHNGPSLRVSGEQAIGPQQADPATAPKELDPAWLTRLASGTSHTWTVTRDGYPSIAPGSYECHLRFPGPDPLVTQAQRANTEARIWLGQIDVTLEVDIPANTAESNNALAGGYSQEPLEADNLVFEVRQVRHNRDGNG